MRIGFFPSFQILFSGGFIRVASVSYTHLRGFHFIAPHIPAGGLLSCKKLYPGLVAHELYDLIPHLVRLLAVLLDMGDHKLMDSRTLAFRVPPGRQDVYKRQTV